MSSVSVLALCLFLPLLEHSLQTTAWFLPSPFFLSLSFTDVRLLHSLKVLIGSDSLLFILH